jgi:hypothetical protein
MKTKMNTKKKPQLAGWGNEKTSHLNERTSHEL